MRAEIKNAGLILGVLLLLVGGLVNVHFALSPERSAGDRKLLDSQKVAANSSPSASATLVPNFAANFPLPKRSLPIAVSPSNPVIVVGMPKAGTSSVTAFFHCGGFHVSHYKCGKTFCSNCVRENMVKRKPPLHRCGGFDVFGQLDFCYAQQGDTNFCYFPQADNSFYEAVHEHYPNATMLLNRRNLTSWVGSVLRWGDLADRFKRASNSGILPFFPEAEANESFGDRLMQWNDAVAANVRDFVRKHPSHALVEVWIDSPSAAVTLELEFGISGSCWKQANANQKRSG